ncbi:DMT family transporter [Amycolatopsis dendrobii]|uniref:DMT family transporter n=1 Tax=Amycolatopsis dendrobii TaxID=2760662 RepID=UPI0028AEE42D|nr:DMT family transporter [Amycolatopsis dendrobii]
MPETPRTRLVRGLAPLTGFAFLTAALDVFAGNQLQAQDPATVAAISFTLAALFFLGGDMLRRGPAATFRPLRDHRYDVLMINVTTAVTWLSMLYALKFLEPAIVNVVGLALGPLLTVLVSPVLRPGTKLLRTEVVISLFIGVMIAMLVWGSFTGHSAVGERSTADTAIGIALTLLTGLGSVTNVIYSKRLSDAGLKPQSVLAVRFFLMLALTWTLVAVNDHPAVGTAFLPSLMIAVVGVAAPLYLLQVGIKHTEPITASILLTLSPLFAFFLQLPDQRLTPSALTFAGVAGIVALVAISTVVRTKHDAAARAAEEAEPAEAPVRQQVRPCTG